MIFFKSCGVEKITNFLIGLFFLSLMMIPARLNSQDYFFDEYGVSEGLAQSTVFDILQDYNDYIWMGTREGVSRFDGNEFFNYNVEDGLAENGVRIVYQDEKNNIWLGHVGGGVSFYDGTRFRVFTRPGEIFDSDITGILKDDPGNLWISSFQSGVVKITNLTDSLSTSDYDYYIGSDLSDIVYSAIKKRDGSIIFNTHPSLKIYNPERDTFTTFELNGIQTFVEVVCMYEDNEENFWLGYHNGGLSMHDPDQDTFKIYDIRDGLASNWISTITEDKDGNIWAGSWGGGVTLVRDNRLNTMDNTNGLSDLYIRKILEDREGNILIGTNENGLSIFKGFQFQSYFPGHGLIDPQVSAILQDNNGYYWFGTGNGISIFNPDQPHGKQFREFEYLRGSSIISLEEDKKSRIWITTDNTDDSIYLYNLRNGDFTYSYVLDPVNYGQAVISINALETDDESRLWIGTADGLILYDFENSTSKRFGQEDSLTSNEITSLYYADDGFLWIGTLGGGLNYFDPYLYNSDRVYSIDLDESFIAKTISSGPDGTLWVGTQANGVYNIDPEKERIIQKFTETQGLLANFINLVISDKTGRIYIGTNKGLNVYNPADNRIYTYNDKNGLPGIETKENSVLLDEDGNIWFGTVNGVTRFNPELLRPENQEPLTHITGFRVNLEEREMTPGMKLKYTENDIAFDYISICLTNPEAAAYRIMLEGADNDWRQIKNQTSENYPALAPGKYTFKVIGRNSVGNWNREPVSYSFEIRPPFYKTTWFILLSIFISVLGVVIYIKIRERNLIREKRILEEKVVERTAEVVAQKEQIAQKNKDITDSIRYAKRIQVATLPPDIPFEYTFVLYKPKDIVSGDFYWLETVGEKEFMAAVDCTGHGVPGAFMSIIGTNLLNKIVKEQHIYQPSEILNILNDEVILSLKSTDEDGIVYDGMDLALVCYDRKTHELQYAGGYNPLVIVRNGDIEEMKADRFAIGRSSLSQPNRKFANHKIHINKGDTIYIYSDGYADQFGGESGKKFKTKPMKELFIAINEKSMEDRKSILNSTIEAWMGNMDQVDDILIIGRRF